MVGVFSKNDVDVLYTLNVDFDPILTLNFDLYLKLTFSQGHNTITLEIRYC